MWHTILMQYMLQRRVHVSWHITAACIGIVIGVVLAREWVYVPIGSVAWALTGSMLILIAAYKSKAIFIVFAVIGGITLGLCRGTIAASALEPYEMYIGKSVTLTGIISEDADTNKQGQLVLRLRDVSINGRNLAGSIWVGTTSSMNMQRSDTVEVTGKLRQGFGNFAASMSAAKVTRVQQTSSGDVALKIRNWFADGVNKAVSEPESSLGLGYLVGQRRGLPEELHTSLQAAGLMHIVVASGYNLTILVRLARRSFENISKYLSFISAAGMIAGFIAITGLSPSMSRAGLVAGLSLVAWYYGRRFHPLVLLPFAMAVTLLVQPSYAWGDMGWLLSFSAFGGVMILAPLIQAYYYGDKAENEIRRIFIETVAATIATLPILIYSFGQFSAIGPIANMAILPLVPLAMLFTLFAGMAGLAVPFAASIIGLPAELLLKYMVSTATYLGNLPWAMQELSMSIYMVVILYVILIAFCVFMKYKTKYDFRTSSIIE